MSQKVRNEMEEIIKIEFELEGIAPIKMDKWIDLPQPKNEKGYIKQANEKTVVCKMTVGNILWEFYCGQLLKGCKTFIVRHPHESDSYTSPKLWDFFDGGD